MGIGIGSVARGRGQRKAATRRAVGARAVLAVFVAVLAWAVAPASAGALETVTRSFPHKGTEETFVVPVGVETIHVLAIGGSGGSTSQAEGGLGGVVEGELHVTPGATLYVEVGGNGAGGADNFPGVGGAPSDVRTSPWAAGLSPDDRLIVAGAGGGAGQDAGEGGETESKAGGEGGAAGATQGGEGEPGIRALGGGGGTQTDGGEAGALYEFFCARGREAEAGSLGGGGLGGLCNSDGGIEGGSGGGGYYGGGGGASGFAGGGGGGGSSLVPAGGSFRLVGPKEQAQVQISYAQPPNPPAVVTAAASEIRRNSATLNGTVNPEDSSVSSCVFQYGPTESYGTTVGCPKKPGSGIAPVAVAAALSGLLQETTYHYRVVATNANGTSYGADQAFTTHPHEPPHVTSVTPNAGPAAGGETVTIAGSELEEATAVSINGHEASSFTVESPEQITAVTPAETPGSGQVIVTTPSGTSQGGIGFTVLVRPSTGGMAPRNGPASGGTTVEILGQGFAPTSEVSFGANPAASVTVVSATEIKAVSPPGVGTVAITVTVPFAGTSAGGPTAVFGYESGAPEFGRCLAAPLLGASTLGGSTDKKCEKASANASGKYQWEPGAERTGLSGTSSGAIAIETVTGTKVKCTAATLTGQITGPAVLGAVTIRFSGCATASGACTSSGLGAGEVQTGELDGSLARQTPGKDLLALAPSAGPFMRYACAGAPAATTVTGSVLVPVKVATMATTTTIKAKASKGLQKPEATEGGERHVLSSALGEGAPVQAGLTLSATLQWEESLEINPDV